MRFFTFCFVALGLLAASSESQAQFRRLLRPAFLGSGSCANGQCNVPSFPAPAPALPVLPDDDVTDQGGAKLAPKAAPTPTPTPTPTVPTPPLIGWPFQDEEPEYFFGVDWAKIQPHQYDSKARKITLIEALEFATGNYDDAKTKLRLVVIGTPDERAYMERAFNEMPALEKENISPWFVSADHWSLRDSDGGELRYVADGKPTVYLLAPDGEPIHRQDGGSAADMIEAIRKGGKKYDPKRDPDLRRVPDPTRMPTLGVSRLAKKYLPVALVGGGILVVASFLRRGKS